MKIIAYVGLDVHQSTTTVFMIAHDGNQPIDRFTIETSMSAYRQYFTRWSAQYDLRCFYEAGGVGFTPYRWLSELGIPCKVIAPSSLSRKSGDHIKTDRRDARKLVMQVRAGDLSFVHVPTSAEEAVRSVCRYRETLKRNVLEFRLKVTSFLRSRGEVYPGKEKAWSQAWSRWLATLRCSEPRDTCTLREYLSDLGYLECRLAEADRQICELADQSPYASLVRAFNCFRGIGVLTAMGVITETLEFKRFPSARSIMAFFGMIPGEDSSGVRTKRLGITKCGNAHCRRLLVEAAWHYLHQPSIGKLLAKRQLGQPPEIVELAWKAQHRLHKRFAHLIFSGVSRQKAVIAVARELLGFLWSAAQFIDARETA